MGELTVPDIPAAIEKLRESHPNEANWLELVAKRDVIALGTDESYALRNSEGEIRCYKSMLTLSKANDCLVKVQGRYTISAQGYEAWATATGASVIFPSHVVVDGKKVGNPHVVRAETSNKIVSVYARAIAFCFSSKGIPQVSDWTTILDLATYRMIDFLAKSKENPQAFQFLPNDMEPIDLDGQKPGTWAKYPFDESTKLHLNTSHPEALAWLSSILNREKKAVDYCQTFAKRNALKHLSGLQKPPQNANTWNMVVYSWRPIHGQMIKWDATQYLHLQGQIESHIHGDTIQVETGVDRVEEDSEQVGMEDTIDPEDRSETDDEPAEEITDADKEDAIDVEIQEPEPEPEVEELDAVVEYSDAEKKIVESYEKARSFFPDEYKEACKDFPLDVEGKHTVAKMDLINQAINNMV